MAAYKPGTNVWNQPSEFYGNSQQPQNSMESSGSPYQNGLDIWGQPSVTSGNRGYQQTNDAKYTQMDPNHVPGTAAKMMPIAMTQGYGGKEFGRVFDGGGPQSRSVPGVPFSFGDMFKKMGNNTSEWFGNQGLKEIADIGLGIKDTFFDRPKLINSYLQQGTALNELRGAQVRAVNANIDGAYRNEQAQNKRTAAFDHSQRLV